MRRLAVAVMALGLTAGAANAAENADLARLTQKAQACIAAAVPGVERAEPSLADGVTFILKDLCAVEIGNRQRYIDNTAVLEAMKSGGPFGAVMAAEPEDPKASPEDKAQAAKLKDAMVGPFDKARLDPDTGEILFPDGGSPGFLGTMISNFAKAGDLVSGNEPDPQFRALAARLLLDARLARKP